MLPAQLLAQYTLLGEFPDKRGGAGHGGDDKLESVAGVGGGEEPSGHVFVLTPAGVAHAAQPWIKRVVWGPLVTRLPEDSHYQPVDLGRGSSALGLDGAGTKVSVTLTQLGSYLISVYVKDAAGGSPQKRGLGPRVRAALGGSSAPGTGLFRVWAAIDAVRLWLSPVRGPGAMTPRVAGFVRDGGRLAAVVRGSA